MAPATDGPFAGSINRSSLLSNIGGSEDSNETITRRVLLLLEGEWLSNEEGFDSIRKCVIERYVKGTPKDHQLALFLLNDIIRYWRTIAVDFAFKTTEGDSPKPWAIRNIKLVFSRKLMYAGGLFAVGMTVDRTEGAKIKILEDLFCMPVIERMKYICGPNRVSKALASYDFFYKRWRTMKSGTI